MPDGDDCDSAYVPGCTVPLAPHCPAPGAVMVTPLTFRRGDGALTQESAVALAVRLALAPVHVVGKLDSSANLGSTGAGLECAAAAFTNRSNQL